MGDKEEQSTKYSWAFAAPFVAAAFVLMMVIVSKTQDAEKLIPFFLLLVIALGLSPLWIWLRYRHELAKKQLEAERQKPADDAPVERLTERLENLETILVRLDLEMNRQMERSMTVINRLAVNAPELSQSPTTLLDMTSA